MAGTTQSVIGTQITATEIKDAVSLAASAAEIRAIIDPGVAESMALLGSMDVSLASIKLGMQIGAEDSLEAE